MARAKIVPEWADTPVLGVLLTLSMHEARVLASALCHYVPSGMPDGPVDRIIEALDAAAVERAQRPTKDGFYK
jgi:hypothetical protein